MLPHSDDETTGPPAMFGRVGPGLYPALLVVDMSNGFVDRASPLACDVDDAIPAIVRLLEKVRSRQFPVVYTTIGYAMPDDRVAEVFLKKMPALRALILGTRWPEIDAHIEPSPGDPVLVKPFVSAFFSTPLISLLHHGGVDTVIVTGASTSGCVRATVVDAMQYGFRVLVPREAVGDRNRAAHEQSLSDIDAKYGDVVGLEETLAYLDRVGDRAPGTGGR